MSQSYLAPGTVLSGRYEIEQEIGRGGYSVVYRARDRQVSSAVAIKLLMPPPSAARLARERMRREVQTVRALSHPNIVAVFDFGDDGPWSYIVMEYVAGLDLHERVHTKGPLTPAEAAALGRDLVGALALAHSKGILHRDVKPQNILLDPAGRARLTDFGSARLADQATVTATGGLVGTPDFVAPEVFAGLRADARADIYSAGLSLYFALTGKLPARESPHLPPTPEARGFRPAGKIPSWLADAVARATTADPDERTATASVFGAELADDLEQLRIAPPTVERCLVCSGSDPLSLGVCPQCSGGNVGDELVFVRAVTPEARAGLSSLWSRTSGQPGDLADVRAGLRPLVRAPREAAARLASRLAERGVAARTIGAKRSWEAIQVSVVALAALVLGAGFAAGMEIAALLFWPAPLLAGAIVVTAARNARSPWLTGVPLRKVDTRVLETLSALAPGPARGLLGRLVRRVTALPVDAAHVVEPLVVAACPVARNVDALDAVLRSAAGRDAATPGVEAERDRLVQHLLEADGALARVQRSWASGTAHTGQELSVFATEMEREAKLHIEAAREVEALLR